MANEDLMQTIDRTMQILKSFSTEEKELSLADLHHKLKLSKSSLQRILNTLIHHGVIEKDDKKKTYQLGIELLFLGQLVEKNSHLLSISKPHMEKLRDEFGESVSLNIINKNKRQCIGYVSGGHELTTITYVGQTSPLYAGASAKLLMAYLPTDELTELLNDIEFMQITDKTIMNREKLIQELSRVHRDGYAISYGERVKGAFSLCAPIRNRFNEVIAGVTLMIPDVRVAEKKIDQYIEHVKITGAMISREFI